MSGINWRPGGAQGTELPRDVYCGDQLLVAVAVCNSTATREWWEYHVITVEEDGFAVDGNGWSWDWHDVDWWVPAKELTPPEEAKRD